MCINDQIMITYNIDVNNGVANGTRGIVIDTSWSEGITVRLKNDEEIIIPFQSVPINESKVNDKYNKKSEITLYYLPVKLAYSTTIHKAQGTTIDFLSIDLGNTIFEYGQFYCGLSRCRNLDSVIITDLSKKSCKCHEKVLKFYGLYNKKMKNKVKELIYNFVINKY